MSPTVQAVVAVLGRGLGSADQEGLHTDVGEVRDQSDRQRGHGDQTEVVWCEDPGDNDDADKADPAQAPALRQGPRRSSQKVLVGL
jgi:hypothetical protein